MEEDVTIHPFDWDFYHAAVRKLDLATCEACAVSQGVGVREAEAFKGWSTFIFSRLCQHSSALIAASPISRWSKREYQNWDLSHIAPHVRAILEGEVFFLYISKPPLSQEEFSAKINTLHLNDCVKRIEFMRSLGSEDDVVGLEKQREEITQRFEGNNVFNALDSSVKKKILSGKSTMIYHRDEILKENTIEVSDFKRNFDFLSHYTHILPMSFYRMEANGRGTGCLNETDFYYISLYLSLAAESLTRCTNRLVDLFPDTKRYRKGLKSKFSFGPKPRK